MFAVFLNNFCPSCTNFYQSIKSPNRMLVDNTSLESKAEREPSKLCIFGFHYCMRIATQPFAPPNKSRYWFTTTSWQSYTFVICTTNNCDPLRKKYCLYYCAIPPKLVVPMPTAHFGKRNNNNNNNNSIVVVVVVVCCPPNRVLFYVCCITYVPIVTPLREENTACQHLSIFLDSHD